MSSKNRWEYGGKVKYDRCMNYNGLTYVTSKERARVDSSVLDVEWSDAPIAYHTHPSLLIPTHTHTYTHTSTPTHPHT